jgi:predicted DNA-binding transcriptional regulator YafY
MSKTAMSIQMLEILYSRGVVGIAELARLLDTNPRNIPEYKKVLEEAGYVIDTIPGRYGGYVLNRKYIFPATNLTDAERDGLLQGFDYLLSRNDFMRKDDFSKAMAKISSSLMATDTPENTLVANRFPLAMPEKEIRERYLAISRSIAAKTVMQIKYLSLSNEVSAREFHPYKLFMYNNTWYTIGFDEKSGEFRYFKLNRIQSFEITGKPFRVPLTYNERDFLDEYGMKQNGEWYPIKLKITGKYAMLVKERIYGKNQTVEPIDKNTSILSVEMQNKEDILHFVLGFGANCEVLEPAWLREKIVETADKIYGKYRKES